jgi:3-oxoacyl-[acyl-carrier protein] reductase
MSASDAENRGLSATIALVTGGARGIGRAIALALAREGSSVAIAARSADELDRTLDELRALHDRVIAVRADITDRAAVDHMVAQTQALLGPIDFLVNNAGAASIVRTKIGSRAITNSGGLSST